MTGRFKKLESSALRDLLKTSFKYLQLDDTT